MYYFTRILNQHPLKFGTFAPRGWIAYWIDGILFKKTMEVFNNQTYPDNGCNIETYSDGDFVELESLSPLTRIATGSTLYHSETWELFDDLEQDFLPDDVIHQIRATSSGTSEN